MGVKGRSGRMVQRFCKRGHDKSRPHGAYIEVKKGRERSALVCAVCRRWRERKRYERKAKRDG